MIVEEIIRKPEVDQNEMEYVVEQYIKERKGVDVKINIPIMGGLIGAALNQQQLSLLSDSYMTASQWFRDNKYK